MKRHGASFAKNLMTSVRFFDISMEHMPIRAQWARCFIRKYGNFGIRVTSGTEASNNNIKSYLLNGMSHLYRLAKAMQDIMQD